ncbi:hypothetical protein FRC12_013329 [Ceratobasidium sp. 428]|nr:hypothetical protein FRC12_013329 [Ceratobasidium sp. 428]
MRPNDLLAEYPKRVFSEVLRLIFLDDKQKFSYGVTSKGDMGRQRLLRVLGACAWIFFCILTLGFSRKYRDRLKKTDSLLANNSNEQAATGKDRQEIERLAKSTQQAEWDRLSTSMSVITATSAAALAIPGLAGPGSYWVISSCFCAALGLSLEGVMMVVYVGLVSGSAPDDMFAGDRYSEAIILALPAAMISYSSLFLLMGTFFMVTHGPTDLAVETHERPFSTLALVPLSFGAFVLVCVIFTSESLMWFHAQEVEQAAAAEKLAASRKT